MMLNKHVGVIVFLMSIASLGYSAELKSLIGEVTKVHNGKAANYLSLRFQPSEIIFTSFKRVAKEPRPTRWLGRDVG